MLDYDVKVNSPASTQPSQTTKSPQHKKSNNPPKQWKS